MRNPDWRAADLSGLPSFGPATQASAVRSSTGAASAAPFGGLYRELNREVTRYIEQGDTASAAAPVSASLSPEGLWSRQRAQVALLGAAGSTPGGLGAVTAATGQEPAVSEAQRQAFVDELMPIARQAASRLGVAPEVLTAQAALETGWGQSPIRRAGGESSHNLFGIKASAQWTGSVTSAATTEIEQGLAVRREQRFRAYDSPAQSFDDLAQLIQGNTRYQAAIGTGADARAYGQALQRGGYATDPAYADKLARVAARIQGGAR
ncbi:glucosaminidase domain-containing protein [Roseateles amylovorans]|uniref:Glucosaminidase domain-containing protein n=1 Tax=Roseateles amylovorans TaxID=2978473 RepID=A0ABY6AX55_9BURK|nr:glucosaminidase domain-containing protein [Roseateles amylovorans]UXH76888.1 glucosaminidase domain-containing protein [Roseateles amylovorans]